MDGFYNALIRPNITSTNKSTYNIMLVKHPSDRFNIGANQIFRSQNHRSTDCNSITSAKLYNKTLQSRYPFKIATRSLFKKAPLKRNIVFICVLFFKNMSVEPAFLICHGILTNSYRHRTNGLLTKSRNLTNV